MKLAMGQYDAPLDQKQPVFEMDLFRSHVAVFGAPMSGKTTFIKTLLVRLHENMDQLPSENVYLLDFGGNVGSYGKLGNVCIHLGNNNEEEIRRVFRTIEKRLLENEKKLNSQNYYAALQKNPATVPIHMTLIIENINTFLSDDRYSSYQDRLNNLCRDGLSKGLSVVITANETHGIGRLLAYFGQKVAFEMPADSYFEIFNAKVSKPMKMPGRGVVNIGSGNYEFQCFLPFATINEETEIPRLVEYTQHYPNEYKMSTFPDELTWDNVKEYCNNNSNPDEDRQQILVGLDYYEHQPMMIDLSESRSIGCYSKSTRQEERNALVALILERVRKIKPEAKIVFLDDGRKQMEKLHIHPNWADSYYLTSVGDFNDFLVDNGYGGKKHYGKPGGDAIIQKTPFTVFVIQSKLFYRSMDYKSLTVKIVPNMAAEALTRDFLFIFSDIPVLTDPDVYNAVNGCISTAFLFDNISEFVAEKGSRSVFGEKDPKELKAEYAHCAKGDGFIYHIDADDLQKVKFLTVK